VENIKAKITDFVEYIEKYNRSSARLLHSVRRIEDEFYDYDVKKYFDDITYITDKAFLKERNVGKKTLAEFKELRTSFLQYLQSKRDEPEKYVEISYEKYCCLLCTDIIETLKTIEDETHFVGAALLEKFERDGIKLVKYNTQDKETT